MVIGKHFLPILALLLLCATPASAKPTATLSVVPTNVTVSGDDATLVTSQTVQVRNIGKGSLRWTVTPPADAWLSVSPTSGTNTGTITVSFPSLFVAGTYTSSFTVNYSNQSITVHVTVTITQAAAPPPSGYGPTADITCPGGAVTVLTTDDLQTAVNANAAGTTFCLEAGTHSVTSAVTPKTGDVFVGEYGAILDGTSWTTTDTTQGAFRAHNQDIDNVTIRNLVIQNMPQKGIHAFYWLTSGWVIEYNEIANNRYGLEAGPQGTIVRNNYIHDNITATPDDPVAANRGGGYASYKGNGVRFEHNEIGPNNGREQKVTQSQSITFIDNDVHDNHGAGIWYDGENLDAVIDGNVVSDNGLQGIMYEISGAGVIRNNTISRSGDVAIFISTSKNVDIYNNTLLANYRGIEYYLNCGVVGQGTISHDLANVASYNNSISLVGALSGSFTNGLSWVGTCTTAQTDPYRLGQKGLTFSGNDYIVASLSERDWVWGFGHLVTWTEWLAVPQDATGTVTTP